ncbi:MAG: hypothetical protein ACLFSC_08315 [Wenzhouxiangella sp.]
MIRAQIEHINPLQPVPASPPVRKKRKKVPARHDRDREPGRRDQDRQPEPTSDDDSSPGIDEYA